MGWMRLRAAATTTRGASAVARRRKTVSLRPTVSGRGERRSCGRVSQLGRTATALGSRSSATAAPRSSASRSVAVTVSTVRRSARAAARNGRSADGPSTRRAGVSAGRGVSRAAASSTACRSGWTKAVRSRPESWATIGSSPWGGGLMRRAHADRPLPGTRRGLRQGYARADGGGGPLPDGRLPRPRPPAVRACAARLAQRAASEWQGRSGCGWAGGGACGHSWPRVQRAPPVGRRATGGAGGRVGRGRDGSRGPAGSPRDAPPARRAPGRRRGRAAGPDRPPSPAA